MQLSGTSTVGSPPRSSLHVAMHAPPPASGLVQPADWLLFLLALQDAEQPLDPVRLQKGMFLLSEEGGVANGEAYDFRPYDYGPFSSDIYRDLQELLDRGWVREVPIRGFNWSSYTITDAGLTAAAE